MHKVLRELKWHSTIVATYVRNRTRYHKVANPYAALWIDPEVVTEKVRGGMFDWGAPGTVLDGDWDLRLKPLEETDKQISVTMRMREDVAWEETPLFTTTFPRRLERRGNVQGMTSMEELASHYYSHIDRLCDAISENGVRKSSMISRISPLYVHIGRDGHILWGTGGNHRLAIAKALQLKEIPVLVHVRHVKWQQWRDTVFSMSGNDVLTKVRPHPDLIDMHPGMKMRLQ